MMTHMKTIHCTCRKVALALSGKAIASLACYCDDCQAAARQLEELPDARTIATADGGTEFVVYREDRLKTLQGAEHLKHYKLSGDSATTRVVAGCCNAPMVMEFSDFRHWASIYRARFEDDAPPLEVRMCTKFKPEGAEIPADVPSVSSYSLKFMGKLLLARIAMVFAF